MAVLFFSVTLTTHTQSRRAADGDYYLWRRCAGKPFGRASPTDGPSSEDRNPLQVCGTKTLPGHSMRRYTQCARTTVASLIIDTRPRGHILRLHTPRVVTYDRNNIYKY